MKRLLSCTAISRTRRLGLLGLALAMCLAVAENRSSADGNQSVPFQGHVTATWDNIFNGLFAPPANFEGGGPVSHMGNTTQSGTLFLEPPDANLMAPGYGSVTIIAANGDSVTFEYEGVLNAGTGEGTGSFTFTSGTGRFANVSGTFDALIDLSFATDQPMTVTLNGSISY
jgi:hypothetical protein